MLSRGVIYTLILENREYNPKIDYLVCKNLAKGLEHGYDEEHIRSVYHKEESDVYNFGLNLILNIILHSNIYLVVNHLVKVVI